MTTFGNLETKLYELECISPIHIGSGENLRSFEYLYDSKNRYVYFINETKWIQFLNRHNLVDAFADRLMHMTAANQNTAVSLWDWLVNKGIAEDELKELGERKAKAETLELVCGEKKSLNDIHVQMATAAGQPYIPGSSIKGALRTAVLYHLIKTNPGAYRFFWRDIEELIRSGRNSINKTLNNGKKIWITFDSIQQNLDKKAFSVLGLKMTDKNGKTINATPEANSVMRGLLVSDAFCTEPLTDTVILQKVDATTRFSRENNLSLYRECIPAGTKIRFTVTIDKIFLSKININSFDEIVAMARGFLQQGIQMQKEIFGELYPSEIKEAMTADILLGGGTGFFSKTVYYQLAPDKTAAQALLKKYFDSKSRHNHQIYDTAITPRTLKLTRTETGTSLMGLGKINEVLK